jgi:hypothetical protein
MERSATEAPLDTTDLAGNLSPNHEAEPELSYWIDSGRVPALPEGTLAVSDDLVVPGQAVELTWKAANLPSRPLRWQFSGAVDATVTPAAGGPAQASLTVAPDAVPTVPKVRYQYERFLDHPPVVYGLYDAERGDLLAAGYLPLEVAPPLLVTTAEDQVRLRPGANEIAFTVEPFDALVRHARVDVAVAHDTDGAVVFEDRLDLHLDANAATNHTAVLNLPDGLQAGAYTVTLSSLPSPTTLAATPVRTPVEGHVFEVEVPAGLHVGVIQSYDNTLEQALAGLDVAYVMLDSTALAEGRFEGLNTIVVDIRAYLVRPDLRAYNDRLLGWVERGGHLIVNYQKTFEWNEDAPDPFIAGQTNPGNFAPYPLELGRDRVTFEDAPVTVLQPDNVLFRTPNEITDDAWEGWVQERGLYFPSTYDDRYEELFSMADPGEDPLRSSTLLAHYGQGTYLYTALVWYRQLKVYHPGTYALFANMVSLPLTDGRAPQ